MISIRYHVLLLYLATLGSIIGGSILFWSRAEPWLVSLGFTPSPAMYLSLLILWIALCAGTYSLWRHLVFGRWWPALCGNPRCNGRTFPWEFSHKKLWYRCRSCRKEWNSHAYRTRMDYFTTVWGCLFIALGILMGHDTAMKMATWPSVEAQVEGVEAYQTTSRSEGKDHPITHYRSRYAFDTFDGRRIHTKGNSSGTHASLLPSSGRVTVYYNPGNPEEIIVGTFWEATFPPILVCLMGMIGLFFGIVYHRWMGHHRVPRGAEGIPRR